MNYPNKTQVPVASHNSTKINLSAPHITTADFMQYNVAKILHLVPGQSVDIKHTTFTRLEPMPVPTFGRARIFNRAYFVPFRVVWSSWMDFINDTPHSYDDNGGATFGIPTTAPWFRMIDLIETFIEDSEFCNQVTESTADFNYGIVLDDLTAEENLFYKFTNLGRWAYKMLRSLGYGITFSDYTVQPEQNNQKLSALPFLCAAKVYCDFYFPAQYAQTQDMLEVQRFFTRNVPEDYFEETWYTPQDIRTILKLMYNIAYSSDYFTSAWDNPVSPNDNLTSDFSIYDFTSSYSGTSNANLGNVVSNEVNGTPEIVQDSVPSRTGPISQYALTALKSLTDYVKRNQIVGSRSLDRYLARYGFNLTAEKLNRCIKISEYSQDIQFGDVTATADTARDEGAVLGSFAGKGLSYGNGSFDFQTVEHGCLIIVSTIVPDVAYYQGLQRSVLHIDKTDFWTPEFDNLGVQAIAAQELYVPMDTLKIQGNVGYDDKIFGFAPRYAEYKIPYAQMTGDYTLRSMNVGKDSWNLFRDVSESNRGEDGEILPHSLNFVLANDRNQYNRIFYFPSKDVDHFNVIHDLNISSLFPGKGVFDTYEFEDEDKSKKVTMDVGGLTDN